jgi:hypothetical protein
VEPRLKIVHDDGKERCKVPVHKLIGSELKYIGKITYNDESDYKWLVMVMTDYHPNVSVIV